MDPRQTISQWLGHTMKIKMTDGRTLIGQFLCTDNTRNVILGSAHEYLHYSEDKCKEEPRMLGLAMIPGKYISSMEVDVI